MKPDPLPNKNIRLGRSKTKDSISSTKSRSRIGNNPRSNSHQAWSFQPKLLNLAVLLESVLPDYTAEFYSVCVKDVRELITSSIRNLGFTEGPKRYNAVKNYTIQLIERRKPQNPGWLATSDVHKVPSCLGGNTSALVIDCLTCSDPVRLAKLYQAIITILNIIRMIDGLSEPEFGSIVEKSAPIDEELLKDFETYVSEILKPFRGQDFDTNLFRFRFHLGKSGPNGKPKIESSIEEAFTLLDSKLYPPFARLAEELGVQYICDYLSALVKSLTPENSKEQLNNNSKHTTYLRKLVFIPDPGCKTRVVAICDFWTQLVLEPVRVRVQEVTERLFGDTDFRKNQDSGVAAMVSFQKRCMAKEIVKGHELDVSSLMFYDISAWTDRFHRDLLKITMRQLFSPRLAEAWAQLVVHCEWYVPSLGSTVKYGQGQGMGTNGSFDVATLADHLFINYIYDKHSSIKRTFKKNMCYGKVGDDLWIYDPDKIIGVFYRKINLPINEAKSKVFGELGSVAEFCSRTFLNGTDVSRISPKVVNKSADYRYIPLLLGLCASRGIKLKASSFTSLARTCQGSEETYFDKLQGWIIGYVVLGRHINNVFSNLTFDYLMEGSWLSEETVQLLSEPKNTARIAVAYSIVSLLRSDSEIKALASETLSVKQSLDFDEFAPLERANLWDLNDAGQEVARKLSGISQVLNPKQIVVWGRYLDQHRLVNKELVRAHNLEGGDMLETILLQTKALTKVASMSCYDKGILSYDREKVFDTQFKIKGTLERLSDNYTVLTLENTEEIQIAEDFGFVPESFEDDFAGLLPRLVPRTYEVTP